ncbi:testis-specific gene 13 protein [Mixophyes fleayi]|uniref:testis-specific gene 13 protein n=1 Tax=Mixophyes fleayi TaxID=3061075 RepID=UPI003F4D827A
MRKWRSLDARKGDLAALLQTTLTCLGQQLTKYFLDPSNKFPISPVHHLLLERVGQSAKDYWRLLREHSETRLMKDITKVPETLMSSNFTQLPSSKFLDQIQNDRKTLGLMHRASEMNQDKSILIMANNPLSDLNGWEKKDSPMQYLSKEDFQTMNPTDPGKPVYFPPLKSTNNLTRDESVGNLRTLTAGKKSYRFLTQEACNKFKGEFSKRCSGRRESKQTLNLKYTYSPTTCIHLPSINAGKNEPPCRSMTGQETPLTYRALMDYRPCIPEPGKADFRHEQSTQWFVKKHHQ